METICFEWNGIGFEVSPETYDELWYELDRPRREAEERASREAWEAETLSALCEAKASGNWDLYSDLYKDLYGIRPERYDW